MCGIVGAVNFQGRPLEPDLLRRMTDTLVHRGPDDEGYFSDAHVAFGFRRLSIIDLVTGHQPMFNEDRTVVVVYNGEIYNFLDVRDELAARGHTFRTRADTEVLVHGYEEWGEGCVDRLAGMFAFAIYDRRRRRVVLGRDRLGVKPLYYAWIGGTMVFASEMKAILAHPEFDRQPRLSALSSYLTFRYPQGDRPVFANMKRLNPGHVMVVTPEGVSQERYWEIPFHPQKENRGERHYLARVEELLATAVKRRLISDVPLGAYLSGGLDSSIVVALMSRFAAEPVKTFSIGFQAAGYDENPYAELVSRHCGTVHRSIVLSQADYLRLLRTAIRIKDAPLSIPHEIALYQMSLELKKDVTVVISGEGADELFGGYGRVQRSPMDFKKAQFVRRFVPGPLQKRVIAMLGADGRAEEWLRLERHADHFFSVYHWIPLEEKWSLFTPEVRRELGRDEEDLAEWYALFDATQEGDPYDRVLYMFEKRHLVCLLDRLDTMSMAASVEARVPFVDHELVEFVSAIPHEYKLKWRSPVHRLRGLFTDSFTASEHLDETKHLLRQLGRTLLPPEIASRRKLGFPVPLDAWMGSGLVETARDILLDDRCRRRGLFDPRRLEDLLARPQLLDFDFWGKKVWMLMNVELWFREFIDSHEMWAPRPLAVEI